MNKYEMFEDNDKDKEQMARIIAFDLCPQKYHKEWYGENAKCYADNNFGDCTKIKLVVDKLYNANYCKLVEGEIVVKESEIGMLKKTIELLEVQKDKLNILLEQAEQEAARKIFKDIEFYGVRCFDDKVWGNHFKLTDYILLDLKRKYGIVKNYGIE